MNNIFIEEIQKPKLPKIDGVEALGVVDSLGLFFKEFSLGIDRKLAGFAKSIHTIDYAKASRHSGSLNYFKCGSETVAVPALYNPDNTKWADYTQAVITGLPIITNMFAETSKFYNWLREVAATGKVGRSFSYNFSSMDDLVSNTEDFLKSLKPNPSKRAFLRQTYLSFADMFDTMNRFNQNVKSIKPRQIEVLSKELDQIKGLGDLIIKRVRANDIVLNANDISELAASTEYFNRAVNIVGAVIGLLNELSAIFTDHCSTVLTWKK